MDSWRFPRQSCSFVSNQFRVQKTRSTSTLTTRKPDDIRRDTAQSNESSTSDRRARISQYRLIEDVKDLDRYRPGGYHSLQIGDELDNARYRVIDKLGYGRYSTIWLARDFRKTRYVAVKVITADASLISSLGNTLSGSGKGVIPPLIDEFWVAGPNGKHKCIVTPPARMSLFDAKEASTFGVFRPKVAQSIVAQLIHGVAFLHSEHIVHDGI